MPRAIGRRASQEPLFELTGGALCLDLANTVQGRLERPRDRLGSYGDLIAWASQAGAVTRPEGRLLLDEAARVPARARAALRRARGLREALYSVFSALARGEAPPTGDLDRLNAAVRASFSRLVIARDGDGFRWRWGPCGPDLDAVVAPVVDSAAEILTSDDVDRIRTCEAGGCAWLFLDRSRNRSRRWCDMTSCGNRAKARRHYRRIKAAGRSAPARR